MKERGKIMKKTREINKVSLWIITISTVIMLILCGLTIAGRPYNVDESTGYGKVMRSKSRCAIIFMTKENEYGRRTDQNRGYS